MNVWQNVDMEITRGISDLSGDDVSVVGSKAVSLGKMMKVGVPILPGFVVFSSVFDDFLRINNLSTEINSILRSVDTDKIHTIDNASKKISNLVCAAKVPENIKEKIYFSFDGLGSEYVAIRSSATVEDLVGATWAGQLESYLSVPKEKLIENIKRCYASLFTTRAIFYRFEKNLHNQKISVAVIVQKMVNSEKSGVAFSMHPVTKDKDKIIIEAVSGIGGVVSGDGVPDTYIVGKQSLQIINRKVQAGEQIVSDGEIKNLSEIILKIESLFGFTCDIEWAFNRGNFFILQSRPITSEISSSKTEEIDFGSDRGGESGFTAETILWDKLILTGKRRTTPFEALLRVESWSHGLDRELGTGYTLIIINSDGEHFVDSVAEGRIMEILRSKTVFDVLRYIDTFYALKDTLLTQVRVKNYAEAKRTFPDLYTYFFIVRTLSEYVYEQATSEDKGKMEHFRNDDTLFEPLDLYLTLNPQHFSVPEWSAVFMNGNRRFIDRKLTHAIDNIVGRDTILSGDTAYPGVVEGTVRLVMSSDDLTVVREGDVVVAHAVEPSFTPILKKASAFITDEGGILSHAAIVAREMKKPCVVGTKNATNQLKNDDLIIVNATKGTVEILNKS